MKMKLELVPVPVSNTDIAKDFYVNKIGFNADHDHAVKLGLRFVQLTPPGSACSIVIGDGTTEMKPGTQKNLQMVVDDVRSIRQELISRGVNVSDVNELPWGHFAYFADPDGNTWALQQIVR
ncbi:MAG TPA: VOC family protein [Candidatus Chromulinivoraceae bacterium]|nr:VOC family protein [Candidatus Chromulinivoraceae bacterium]